MKQTCVLGIGFNNLIVKFSNSMFVLVYTRCLMNEMILKNL